MTEEKANALAARLLARYLELGEQARLNNNTLASLAGLTRARVSQLRRGNAEEAAAGISLATFLRLYQAVPRLQAGLREGWLPAAAIRGEAQEAARLRLLDSPSGGSATAES